MDKNTDLEKFMCALSNLAGLVWTDGGMTYQITYLCGNLNDEFSKVSSALSTDHAIASPEKTSFKNFSILFSDMLNDTIGAPSGTLAKTLVRLMCKPFQDPDLFMSSDSNEDCWYLVVANRYHDTEYVLLEIEFQYD